MQELSGALRKPVALSRKYEQQDFEQVEEWLENWRRWGRSRLQYARCMSLESRYKSPQCWHPPEPKYMIDVLQAEKLEDIWRKMPHRYKKLLKMHYIKRYSELLIMRRLRIRDLELDLAHAKRLILERW